MKRPICMVVFAGLTSRKNSPCTSPTARQSSMRTSRMRVRITSSLRAPSCSSAASEISRQRRAWAAGSPWPTVRPLASRGAVPATETTFPMRTARERPMIGS